MPNGKVDEGEIALIIGEGGLKKATLARRKRIQAHFPHFQAFTLENYQKDLTFDLTYQWTQRGRKQSSLCIPLNTSNNNHALLMS